MTTGSLTWPLTRPFGCRAATVRRRDARRLRPCLQGRPPGHRRPGKSPAQGRLQANLRGEGLRWPLSDSKLNATESPKLFATDKKSHDTIVLLLEQAKHQQQTVSRIRPWQNHSLAEAALCCCRFHGVRGDHRAGSWEAETRTYSCCGGTARSFY